MSSASTTADLTWTGTGTFRPVDLVNDPICIGYTFPPTVWLCPKPLDYAVALGQRATVTGSITYGGLEATLSDPASGRMYLEVFLP